MLDKFQDFFKNSRLCTNRPGYKFYKMYLFAGDQGLTSSSKNNSANVSGEEKYNEAFRPGCLFFDNTRKNFKSNLVLESESLYEPSFGGILNKVFKTYIPGIFHCVFGLDLEWL